MREDMPSRDVNPRNALLRAVADGILDAFFRIDITFHHFQVTCFTELEHFGTSRQTTLTKAALAEFDNGNSGHFCFS
jgi:hypothetical protein